MIFRWLKKFSAWLASFGTEQPQPKQHTPRTCDVCGSRIKRNHKWFYFEDGTRHRDCSDPTMCQPFLPMGAEHDTPAQTDEAVTDQA